MKKKKNEKQIHTQILFFFKYKCIESVLTSLSDSCTAYLLIDEMTGSMGTI